MEKLQGKSEKDRRNWLFQKLEDVINLSDKKIHGCHTSDADKRAWCRVMCPYITAYGGILKDVELEKLAMEIDEIKKTIEDMKK